MNISALIPARISSKRLPRKNIKLLAGKPLLFWSIDVALEADIFNRVCVSTESEEVAQMVRDNYAASDVEVIHRPPVLATDSASLNDVCKHFLENAPEVDVLSLMMPTYPFRKASRMIEEIVPPLYSGQIDLVNSVRHGNYSTFDYWIPNGHHFERMYTHMPLWCGAGNAAYAFQKKEFFFIPPPKWPHAIGERALRIQTDFAESIDIDTQNDFNQAEKISAEYRPRCRKLVQYDHPFFDFILPESADGSSLFEFLSAKGVDHRKPVLILGPADPLFSFLRTRECGTSSSYITETTNRIIADLPESGHSQDFPIHYIHSPHYRVLRKGMDKCGISESIVPVEQIVMEETLKTDWADYVDPIVWTKGINPVD